LPLAEVEPAASETPAPAPAPPAPPYPTGVPVPLPTALPELPPPPAPGEPVRALFVTPETDDSHAIPFFAALAVALALLTVAGAPVTVARSARLAGALAAHRSAIALAGGALLVGVAAAFALVGA
jgi:hypothetical protein